MRYAFIMGSNGPESISPLKFAERDAERMKTCLEGPRCAYEVIRPPKGTRPFKICESLTELAEQCTPEDTFICYFSGHGVLDKGELFLLWDETDIERLGTTAIPSSSILQALSFCKAHSTLLILDCCHAGGAINNDGLRSALNEPVAEIMHPDNHLVLMASDRLERARELEELEGGFLTKNIVSAVDENFHRVDKSEDGKISLNELVSWLQEKARLHNEACPKKKVPYPYTFGQERGDFILTVDESGWTHYEFSLPDGSVMVVLPVMPMRGKAFCIAKHPVTNKQYKRFLERGFVLPRILFEYRDDQQLEHLSESSDFKFHNKFRYLFEPPEFDFLRPKEPEGKGFSRNKVWEGPFFPWKEEEFNADCQPVVCVNLIDALSYCNWMNLELARTAGQDICITLPADALWDFTAFGTSSPNRKERLVRQDKVHHQASYPLSIDLKGERTNSCRISDMIGNVWEWCLSAREFLESDEYNAPRMPNDSMSSLFSSGDIDIFKPMQALVPESEDFHRGSVVYKKALKNPFWSFRRDAALRGGSFLDDIEKTYLSLSVEDLEDSFETRHSDLGFRIAGTVSVESLPDDIKDKLSLCRPLIAPY